MIPAPHPVLRRLYALGSVPGRFLDALASSQPTLDGLSRELDGLPLLSDAALEALARGLDLSPLDARLDLALACGSDQEASEAGGGEGRRIRPEAGAAGEEGRIARMHHSSGAARPTGEAEAGPRPAPALPRPGQVEALLGRYAPGPGGPPSGALADRRGRHPRPEGGRERTRPYRGAWNPVPGSDDGGTTGEEMEHRRARGGPSGDSSRISRRPAPAGADASGALLRRAVRAGSLEAATTPVGTFPAPPDIDAVLAESASGVQRRGVPPGGRPGADTDANGERLKGAPLSGLSQVARAVARLERRRPRPTRPDAEPALPPLGQADPAAPSADPGGLRGLVRRLTSLDSAPAMSDGPVPIPRQGVPDLLVERTEDAILADRIAAVLRREAARHGIDVEGVD